MNHIYRVVWNESLGVWQAVAEYARSRGKTKSKRVRSFALAVALSIAGASHAADLPTGGSVAAGSGSIHQSGKHLTINQGSGKLAIDWQSFSIGKDNSVTFHQPSASAVALNRVIGSDVSVIQGALNANGHVFLINPNGVLFTPTAQIDVGGLVASTLNLSKEDFLAGNYKFAGDSAGSIINQGSIAANGGTIALIAAKVENSGTITAHGGNVLLGSGSKVTLDLGGPVKLEVEEGALGALIKNGGAIKADGGTILLTAKAAEDLVSTVINNDGIIEAKTLVTGERGEVVLLGENGTVEVVGTIDVSAPEAQGGKAVVTGERVLIADGAHIDATGANGGGEIYVGGGWQGRDPAMKQATATVVMQGAVLDASATDNGDGGTVVAWSDVGNAESITRVAGALKATGGAKGGDGGRIETSGHGLEVGKVPDVSAAAGNGGEWLIDPYNITVVAGGSNTNINGASAFESTGDSASLGIDLIDTALANGSVTIQTGSSGAQGGDITWDVDYTYNGSSDTSLTLNAHRDIILNKSISGGSNAALSMTFSADSDNNGTGGVVVKGNLDTKGGSLTFNGLGTIFSGTSEQTISTDGGNIQFSGEVLLANPSGLIIASNDGDVTFDGTVNSGNSYTYDSTKRSWHNAKSAAESGAGDAVHSTYLATITSALENTAVMAAAAGDEAWIGASDWVAEGTWRWMTGPEGMEDGGAGRIIQTSGMGGSGYVGADGAYVNWAANEPNNADNTEHYAHVGFGVGGQWNDIGTQRDIGSIVETNLADSPLTINAGAGTVTFGDKVGTNKALGNLTVNGTGAVRLQTDTIISSGTIDIDPAVQLDAGAGTTYNISGATIAWNGDVDYNGIGTGSTLSLNASGDISIKGNIEESADGATGDDALSVVLNAGGGVNVHSRLHSGNGGNVDIDADGSIYVAGSIVAEGSGTIDMYSTSGGVQINSGAVQVTDGDLTVDVHANVNPINHSWIRSTGSGDINLTSRTTSIHIGGTYNGGGIEATGTGNVALVATDLGNSYGALRGNSELRVMTYDADGAIVIGGAKNTTDGKLNVSSEWLGFMQNGGFDHVIIGRTDGAGAVNVGAAAFNQKLTVQTGGDISVNGALSTGSDANAGTITLQAGNNISVGGTGSITTQGEALVLNSDRDGNGAGAISMESGSSIKSNGGHILMRGGSAALGAVQAPTVDQAAFAAELQNTAAHGGDQHGVWIKGATVDAGGGNIEIRGHGHDGVAITDDARVETAGAGDIAIYGAGTTEVGVRVEAADISAEAGDIVVYGLSAGSNSDKHKHGVYAANGAEIRATAGNIELSGHGSTNGSGTNNEGVKLQDGALVEIESGTDRTLAIHGYGGTGTSYNIGVNVRIGSIVRMGADATGRIDISGTGGGGTDSGTGNWGVLFEGDGVIESLAAAAIDITGTGGGGSDNHGIKVTGGASNRIGSGTMTGDITLTADTMDLQGGGTLTVAGQGDLLLQPLNAAATIGLGDGASGSLNLNATELSRLADGFNSITIGRADGAGAIDVRGATFEDEVTLRTQAGIAIDGALNAAGQTVALLAGGGVTQAGSITANSLHLAGIGDYVLSGANSIGTLAADVDGDLLLRNNGALTVGSVDGANGISATGTIDVSTEMDHLTVNQNIVTTDASAHAVVLNAGRTAAAGTETGGDIVIGDGATIATGADGRVTLYTGSIDGSTGLVDAAGSGHYRYGSDETTTNYTAALGKGVYAIYREQPTLSVEIGAAKGQYGDTPDLSDVSYTVSGYKNGDIDELTGMATYTTDATVTSNVGSYDIAYADGLESTLGYAFADDTTKTGEYTVEKRVLNLSGARTYDGTVDLAAAIFDLDNLANGDTLTVTGAGTMADKHAGDDKAVTLGTIALADGADGDAASNYTLTGGTHTVDIAKAAITISTNDVTKTYDGDTSATGAAAAVTGGSLFTDDSLSGGSFAFTDQNAGNNKTVTVSGVTVSDGNDGDNYIVTYANNTTSTINKKSVTIGGSFTVDDKVYDGSDAAAIATNSLTVDGTVGTETLDLAALEAVFADKNAAAGKTVSIDAATLADGDDGGLASNYVVSLVGAPTATATITPKALTVSGTLTASDRIYDGTTAATVDTSGLVLTGLVTGEDLDFAGVTSSFADKNAADDIVVSLDEAGLADGTAGSASNYTLTLTGAPTTTADILRRAVTVTADHQSKLQGTADPALTYAAEAQSGGRGLLNGESLVGVLSRASGEGIGDYVIGPGTLTDANNGNYVIEFVEGAFSILPATKVEAARHVAQTLPQALDPQSQPNGHNGMAAGGSGNLQFVGVSSTEAGGLATAGASEGSGTTGALRSSSGPLTVLVVDGGIRLPTSDKH